MESNVIDDYEQFKLYTASCGDSATTYLYHLWDLVFQTDQQNRYSKPMPWIGTYIALASLFCILAMVADLVHGLRTRRLWFPCKYFTLNAASITVIGVAMKLPMDLTNPMPGYVDQAAKLASLGFMCAMMANLLPSLATMNNKELFTNLIALGVLVITLVVNVCIQISTGPLSYQVDENEFSLYKKENLTFYASIGGHGFLATIYVCLLLMLLIIYACSSLAIVNSKQILESEYKAAHETASRDQELQQQPGRLLTVEKLEQLVRNSWIMALSGSPQFMTACYVTTSATGVICGLSTIFHILVISSTISSLQDYKSDYKWSTLVIHMIQFVGVIVGTIAPVSRCFAALRFKLSVKWIWNHSKVFQVESFWTHELCDWKCSSIPFPSTGRKGKIVTQHLQILILSICIGFQKAVVVACKIIALIPIFFVICVVFFFGCWKWVREIFSTASGIQNPDETGIDTDLSRHILQIQDDIKFNERTLKGMFEYVNDLIQKAGKQQPKNLMKLLAESRGFEGVEKFDSHHVPSLLSEEYLNCWSLPLVTLTTIAMSLPNIQNNIVDCLLIDGVREGLVYVTLVEESLNAINDHLSIQKAAKHLWVEVEVCQKWLGNKLQNPDPQVNTAGQILQGLRDTAKTMVMEIEGTGIGVSKDNFKHRSICANSMYRITETIRLSYHTNIDELSQEELFVHLSLMIADILAACLTNLPQVIAMKCQTKETEKREASDLAAAQLFGETEQIINTLQERELPSLNPEEMAFIDKWRAYLMDPFP